MFNTGVFLSHVLRSVTAYLSSWGVCLPFKNMWEALHSPFYTGVNIPVQMKAKVHPSFCLLFVSCLLKGINSGGEVSGAPCKPQVRGSSVSGGGMLLVKS